MACLVGVDVGGTFTDFLMVDPEKRLYRVVKIPTTSDDQARAFADGLALLDVDGSEIGSIVHGTTVGTNAVLERNGARCGLITTRGFRDVLELGRRTRPYSYGLSGSFEPLIPRQYRYEVRERMDAQGHVLEPLHEEDVHAAVKSMRAAGVESVVIHFLHAYANPEHERRCREIVRTLWPNDNVVAGHQIMREMREFERCSTAAIHGAIRPIVSRYIGRVAESLQGAGMAQELLVMQANGGMMAASLTAENAVHTVMSGPAAGVLAAAEIARACGHRNVISADMGGTSYDVALVIDGSPVITAEKDLAYGVPVRVPMIDMHTIGAGGGSIARVDAAGILRVGPQSAGSEPGPIGYGRGGTEPTITDANLLLGRLNAQAVTGSDAPAPLDRIEQALSAAIGRHLGLDGHESAAAVLDVAINQLAGAIRLVSIEKGYDPRDFALMPFGGGGPLHAVAIARELGIPKVIVPRFPGLTSALGCVLADVRHDFVRTVNRTFEALDAAQVDAIFAAQEHEGRALLGNERVDAQRVEVRHEADLLYQGQSHFIRVPVQSPGFDARAVLERFSRRYRERFGISLAEMKPVFVNARTTVVGMRKKPDLSLFQSTKPDGGSTVTGVRRAFFDGQWHETAVYRRETLKPGASIAGPAIVEQLDSTLVIDPGATASVDGIGSLIVDVA